MGVQKSTIAVFLGLLERLSAKKRSHGVLSRKKSHFKNVTAVNVRGKKFKTNTETGIGVIRRHVSRRAPVNVV